MKLRRLACMINIGSSQNFVGGMKDAHMTIPDEQV
ncbi:MAG TPA: hypothetical protein DEB17_03100 [Chlorobaculum sp.]|uniref:Uncharacterized protein n=1 Tax=Chlorobaculum tepidum (strain ATCC 49652 / DSM 12025 / NBRC 103806 / TLS) TaxID=194439 RepID=Q8KE71_CHLTE|nr:hypothetical protein CT0819 [Chlorobaculum tepidum TLS]HBU22973.1 hypothetical protein [Chlorobaculum sp.]